MFFSLSLPPPPTPPLFHLFAALCDITQLPGIYLPTHRFTAPCRGLPVLELPGGIWAGDCAAGTALGLTGPCWVCSWLRSCWKFFGFPWWRLRVLSSWDLAGTQLGPYCLGCDATRLPPCRCKLPLLYLIRPTTLVLWIIPIPRKLWSRRQCGNFETPEVSHPVNEYPS